MGSLSLLPLSDQVGGFPGFVTDDSTPGTELHDCSTTADVLDEVWLFLNNNSAADVDVILVFDNGGTPQEKKQLVPAKKEITAIAGVPFNSVTISAYVITADLDKVVASGFVRRIDQS